MAYDVFISYAHVDDEPLPPATEGWVSTLIRSLKVRLAQKIGRREACTVWMDGLLAGNEPLTPQILDRVREAATMVVIFSPGYRASEWCNREKNAFLQMAGVLGSRLFIVERDRAERPSELADLRGYRFWVEDTLKGETRTLGDPLPTADDRLYFAALGDLAADLARELQQQRQPQPSQPADAPSVFLAEVTDDLDPVRDEVRRYLEQKQIRVVPNQCCLTRGDAAAFRGEVDALLSSCTLFVQLLGPVPGKKPPDADATYVELQLERAQQAQRRILQWRDPDLVLAKVRDPRHAALLQGSEVLATGLEELKNEIIARLAPAAPPRERAEARLVFVNAEGSDLPFAEALSKVITQCGAGCVLPLRGADPAEVRADLEQNLLDCDDLMIVYGATTPSWVREQLRYARKVLFRREHDLQGLAVYQAPPVPKPPIGFELPNLSTIDGLAGVNENGVRHFLTSGRS